MGEVLPKGWHQTKLNELTTIIGGGTPKTSNPEYYGNDIPWLSPVDLSKYTDKYISKGRKSISELGLKKSSARLLPKDTVVFSSRAPIGYVAIASNDLSTNQGFKNLLPSPAYVPSYAYYYLKYAKDLIESHASGTTFKEISGKKLGEISIPLPPLPEQKLIVAKLDALFGHLETLKTKLDRIPELLKNFRQQVLTQAVTGKLTEEWREGKGLREWQYVGIDKILRSVKSDLRTGPFGSSLKKSDHQSTGVPVWGIESISKKGEFTGKNKIFVNTEKAEELKSFSVKGGDIIISRSGTVGEICVLPNNVPHGLISTNLMKIIVNPDVMNSTFFSWLFKGSVNIREKLIELCKGSTRLFLTQSIIKQLEYPLPSLSEQQQIVVIVNELFVVANRIESQYLTLKDKIDHLPQAMLTKAFKGELVPQDPNDEPASVLLERITLRQAQDDLKKIKPNKPESKAYKKKDSELSIAAEEGGEYVKS